MSGVGALRNVKFVLVLTSAIASASAQTPAAQARGTFVRQYCIGCHSERLRTGGIALENLDAARVSGDAGAWERVLRQVGSGQMPPAGMPHPDDTARSAFAGNLEAALDQAARANPNPGKTMPHRLNRVEYSNAVRDLLALDTRPGEALPVDDSGNGFDNQADVLTMSPSLIDRYLSLARSVSLAAVGDLKTKPNDVDYLGFDSSADRPAKRDPDPLRVPFGANRGMFADHYFPLDAEYELRIQIRGLTAQVLTTQIATVRIPVKAGFHHVVTTFPGNSLREEIALAPVGRRAVPARAPKSLHLDIRMDDARLELAEVTLSDANIDVGKITVTGPYRATGRGDTPSRRQIFVCRPSSARQEPACAKRIFTNLAHHAFRRPVLDADVQPLVRLYEKGRAEGGDFDEGIRRGLQAILISPDFLFRVEHDPKGAAPGSVYRLSDHELASRLSFFLWSSIPDDELLTLADQGKLRAPGVLKAQVRRMMADAKSDALIDNFAGQWLLLRNLASARPDTDVFTHFDENLRQAFLRETQLFLTNIFREDRPALEMMDADYAFLNERLAKHYGIPNVYGPQYRKVSLPPGSPRGGLLGQGSVLTVTSYPNRTSVVQRGKWVLENILGAPPPPPPADVPALKAHAADGRKRTIREAMEEHRNNPLCASCHSRMDPIGFALENFDGVGEWRDKDGGVPIDASGRLPNSEQFNGGAGLTKLLLEKHKGEFIGTVTEKLMIYALGRGVAGDDRPAIRAITRKAAEHDYRMSAFIEAVVESVPFQMRRAGER
jgi:cytochrome c551/c552